MSIRGNTVGNVSPRANWAQEDPAQADFILGKEQVENAIAETKEYVDSKHFFRNVVLSAASWAGDAAPFTQEVAADGIVSTDKPHWGIVYSEDQETRAAEKEAIALVDELDTIDGGLVFTCFEEKPEVDLTIQLEVNR